MKNRVKFLVSLLRPDIHWFLFYIILVIPEWAASTIVPKLIGQLVDEFIYQKNMSSFLTRAIIYTSVYLAQLLFNALQLLVFNYLKKRITTRVHNEMFSRVFRINASTLNDMKTGDIMDRINGVQSIVPFIIINVFWTIGPAVRLIITFIILCSMNLYISLAFVILLFINVFSSRIFSKKMAQQQKEYQENQGNVKSWLMEVVNGLQEIKLMAANNKMIEMFTSKLKKLFKIGIKNSKTQFIGNHINSATQLIALLIMYSLSALLVIQGDFTIGAFVACLMYYNDSIASMNNIINNIFFETARNNAIIDRVKEVYDQPIEDENGKELIVDNAKISFKNIWFGYSEDSYVLRDFSMEVSGGEKIALVGRSGVGKSTAVSLLLKLYKPNHGSIFVDNQDIADCSISSIRKNISIVQQDTFLFNDSIRNNICQKQCGVSDDEIWSVLDKTKMKDFVKGLPDGLDTILGVNQIDLSGGQKQRLLIARAFLLNTKIVIFDEATSSLDNETEKFIYNAWKDLSYNHTMIVIAHRISTITSSDKVVFCDDGKIVACGQHNELLDKCKAYNKIFNKYLL